MIFAEVSPLYYVVGGSLVMMVLGLALVALSVHAQYEILKILFKWVGIVVAVLGLLLFLIRPLIWLANTISNATGAGGTAGP